MKLNGDLYRVISMTQGEGTFTFCIGLNQEHWIRECHFPGNPIIPGVFLLQTVAELLGELMGCKLYIKEIKNVKFINIMSPQANPEVCVKLSGINPVDGGMKVQAVLSDCANPARLFARMSMTLQENRI